MPMAVKRKPTPVPTIDSIILVELVAHREGGEDAKQIETRNSLQLKTKEQPYERKCVATPEWQPLDLGWLAGKPLRMLLIRNEKPSWQRIPTEAEKLEASSKVLELSYSEREDESWYVDPGMTTRGRPGNPSALRIRCVNGEQKFLLWACPE